MTSTNPRIETVAVAGPFTLSGELRSGGLRARASEGLKEVRLTVSAVGPRADEMIQATRITLEETHLAFEVPQLRTFLSFGTSVHLDVEVPAGTDVNVTSSSGSVELQGKYSTVQIENSSGSIRVDRANEANLQASSGSIRLGDALNAHILAHSGRIDVASAGQLEAESSSGAVHLGTIAHRTQVKCNSGGIKAKSLDGDISLESTSGSIRVDSARGLLRAVVRSGSVKVGSFTQGNIEAHSSSGSISVGFPSGTAVQADAQATSGLVRTDLAPIAGAEGFEREATIVARSRSGSITLSRALYRA